MGVGSDTGQPQPTRTPQELDSPEKGTEMTLCIAAECNRLGTPAIVLCRDWQAQKGSLTSDDADKQRDVDEGCRVLIAGAPTRADHLLTQCEPAIRTFMQKCDPNTTDLDTDQLLQDLRKVTKAVRKELVDDWVFRTLNMEFDEFRKNGRHDLLESHYHDIWESIRRFDIGAELLITLFDAENDAVVIRTDGLGEVHWELDYSIIGTGGDIARAFMCQIDYDPSQIGIDQCIYEVLRAKLAAEMGHQVGRGTTITVTEKGKKDLTLSVKGFEYYSGLLIPYKAPPLEFKSEFLELADDEEETNKMPVSEVWKKIEAAESTASNTSPELSVPYIINVLKEIAKVLEELEKRENK